jgi:hypothetical protein
MLEPYADADWRQNSLPRLGPLDEDDRVVEVRLEIAPLRRRHHLLEAKEVEVRHVDSALVPVADGVRRARDRTFDAERAGGAADERRLPGAELARDRDDVARAQVGGEPGSELLRFFRRVCLDQKRPSWTAGSAAA